MPLASARIREKARPTIPSTTTNRRSRPRCSMQSAAARFSTRHIFRAFVRETFGCRPSTASRRTGRLITRHSLPTTIRTTARWACLGSKAIPRIHRNPRPILRSRWESWATPWPGASTTWAGIGGRPTVRSSAAMQTAGARASTRVPASWDAPRERRPAPTSPTGPRQSVAVSSSKPVVASVKLPFAVTGWRMACSITTPPASCANSVQRS